MSHIIDKEIEKYNKNLSFFKRKNKIKKELGNIYVGQSYDGDKPQILKRKTPTSIIMYGNKNRLKEIYKELLFQKIDDNESFIFVNDIFEDDDYLQELKEYVLKSSYRYDLIFNDYEYLNNKVIDHEAFSYIFNVKNESHSRQDTINFIETKLKKGLLSGICFSLDEEVFYKRIHRSIIVACPDIDVSEPMFSMFRGIGYTYISHDNEIKVSKMVNTFYIIYFEEDNNSIFDELSTYFLENEKSCGSYLIEIQNPQNKIRLN